MGKKFKEPPRPKPDLWALWPDHFMCPVSEIDEYMTPPCARSDDYEVVTVIDYDSDGMPDSWMRKPKNART